ncbi:MAG: DUF2238 domain-containing protein [Proteobacteria bacterium]|nr:DUF2238 domain-containing protein [Pseudomonadota bacterium]
MTSIHTASRVELIVLLCLMLVAMIWSYIGAHDPLTWWLEVIPVMIGLPLAWLTRSRFPLTRLLYWLLFVHALILILGGHYTYARVPLGFWLQDWFDLSRNHYDRLGHLAQGFIPAILAREILFRNQVVTKKGWLFFLSVCVCLAFSALYELIEWWAAIAVSEAADAFLGTQGDVWDTQWDMFMALIGAVLANLVLARVHLAQMGAKKA